MCVSRTNCVLGKLVLRSTRIVIPKPLPEEVLRLAHKGHRGIVKMNGMFKVKGLVAKD